MTAILGGLGAAILWATATLASSRTSRMIGSRVVLGWVMLVGAIVGLPLALVAGVPTGVGPDAIGLLLVAGVSFSAGLYTAYRALTIGKVSIVAPIIATEGALAAVIAVALGDAIGALAGITLAVIATGIVLASMEPARPDVPALDIELAADALDGPPAADLSPDGRPRTDVLVGVGTPEHPEHTRQAVVLSILAAAIFAVGLVAAGKAAPIVGPIWVAMATRIVGLAIVTLPLVLQGRFTVTRAAFPLVVLAGVCEIGGSTLMAWGSIASIPIAAVLGSQFAAIAAVAAFILFGERLSRIQVAGVVLIALGVTVLAATSA